jgi:endonuclease YncB( thermonuclease family)
VATKALMPMIVGILVALAPAIRAQAPAKGTGAVEALGPVRVIDGDTLEVYIDGKRTGVGIVGIKAPRGNSPCGKQATAFLHKLVNQIDGQDARIKLRFEEDSTVTFDSRNRRMYHLKLPGGVSAGAELVRAGLANLNGTVDSTLGLGISEAVAPKCTD